MAYSLGIDLGTTFTAAAVARNGRVDIVGMGNHTSAIPSAVLLRDDGTLLVGDAAVRRGQQEPARLAKEFKRRLGDATPIILGHTPYSAERLMAAVIRHVVDTVTERQGGPPSSVVIAHPANWGPFKRELLEGAAALADVRDVAFVTEPEAAAVHFAAGERVDEGGVVAVYDLGGGTFDAAVLRRVGDRFVTLGQPQGIERLGGIDLDEAVMSHVRATLGDAFTSLDTGDPVVRSGLMRLRADCVAAKEALSADSETVIPVMLPGLQTQVRLTRPEFESMIRPVLGETVTMLQRAIEMAGVTAGDLSAVVLAGGSSRIPLVAETVSAALGQPVSVDAHPKDTVALGAARLASGEDRGTTRDEGPAAAAPTAVAREPVATTPSLTTPSPASPATPSPAAAPTPSPTAATTPSPEGATAPAPAAAATPRTARSAPAASQPASRRTASPPAAPTGRRSKGAIVAAAAVAVAALGAAAVFLFGGDDDGGDAASDDGDDVVETAGQQSGRECTAETGRCVFITGLDLEGDTYVATYETAGYKPHVSDDPDSRHVHFWFQPPIRRDLAGAPQDPANWTAWGLEEGGGDFVYRFAASEVPGETTQLCAAVANPNHGLDDEVFECVTLPRP